ncbi:MAG: FecR domain-containing protein [Chitinophagaceae bacterium]|nr:FecR domain-containing protein [Chitinophagaceae bacterium]
MHTPEYIQQLLKGHFEGSLSPEDESILMEALRSGNYRDIMGKDILHQLETSSSARTSLPPQTRERMIQNILASPALVVPISRNRRRYWIMTAAAAMIVIISATLLYTAASRKNPAQTDAKDIINTTAETNTLHLEDGSAIQLEPGAHLSYPPHFTGSSRTVRLEGNAFFKIATDPGRPFYVYCGDIITHVLGTSFHISAQKDNAFKIAVRTGKVEVSRSGDGQQSKIMLFPNQQLTYTSNTASPQPTLVDTPLVLTDNPDPKTFTAGETFRFKAASLNTISALIKEKYGIDIVMDKPALGKTLFTGDLSHQPLYTALKIICLSVNAGYEIKGTKIFVNTIKM